MKPFLVVVALLISRVVAADTFEHATYVAPAGWKAIPNGFQRADDRGVGQIRLIAGHAASKRALADEFAAMWRARVAPDLKGAQTSTAAPRPEIQVDGDMTIAVGGSAVTIQDVQFNVVLATIRGRGRVFGIAGYAAGDATVAELVAFFDKVEFGTAAPASPSTPAPAPPAPAAGKSELGFTPPPGYSLDREHGITFKPDKADAEACIYGIGPTRAGSGSLEADAKAALREMLGSEWKIKWEDRFDFRRGIAVGGWSFYWYKTYITRPGEEANAMAMAIGGAGGKTHVVYGVGGPSCLLDDAAFAHLFHGLRVPGIADGGKQIAAELAGYTWRMTAGSTGGPSGMMQYSFSAKGRYWYGYGVTTQLGYTETTTTSSGDGSWAIKDGVLVLAPDRKDRGVQRVRVRLYDWPVGGTTKRVLGWFAGSSELEFFRIDP